MRKRPSKTCNICHQGGLRWGIDEETDRYVLEDTDGSRHVCKMTWKVLRLAPQTV